MDGLNKHEDQLGRGLTYDLWKNFPMREILIDKDYNEGIGVMLDPAAPPKNASSAAVVACHGGWLAYADAAEYIRGLIETEGNGGGCRMFTTTDNTAAEIQAGGGGEPFIISDTAADCKELILEVAFRAANITVTKAGWFIGLASDCIGGDAIADAGTLAAADSFVGLMKAEGGTTELNLVYQLGGQTMVTHKAAWKTLAAATWYHFGLRYNPSSRIITPWWGTGVRATTKMAPDTSNIITAADIASAGADKFPDGSGLTPVAVIKAAHADDFYLDIRQFACAQRAYAGD